MPLMKIIRRLRLSLRRPTTASAPPARHEPASSPPAGTGVPKVEGLPEGSAFWLDASESWCSPLQDPRWVGAGRASYMRPDDPVLGFECGGEAWALPWWVMKNHHVANVLFGARPVLVTFCERCSSAAAFEPRLDGVRELFRLTGVYNGTIMVSDATTDSLWTGFTGEAIRGPRKGICLERLPLLQCTWKEWVGEYPHTQVADGAGEPRDGHGSDHSPGSPGKGVGMGGTLLLHDDRLPHNELVLGADWNGERAVYPLAALSRVGPVLNDTLGGRPIVVLSRPGTLAATAFLRELGGRTLTFLWDGADIRDEETGSRWRMNGEAVDGPWRGRHLDYVPSGVEEFYTYAAAHPGTLIRECRPVGSTAAEVTSARN